MRSRLLAAIAMSALLGWLIGRISFKVRGAYFVIVTISFAEVVRLVALNWVELTQGPMALNNIPPVRSGCRGSASIGFSAKSPNYYLVLAVAVVSLRPHPRASCTRAPAAR